MKADSIPVRRIVADGSQWPGAQREIFNAYRCALAAWTKSDWDIVLRELDNAQLTFAKWRAIESLTE